MIVQQRGKDWPKAAGEFSTLGLWALAVYLVLSLVSYDAGRQPNLGGALGDALVRTLERAFGYAAYILPLLVAWLGWSVWTAVPIRVLLRYTVAGLILLLTLSTGLGKFPVLSPSAATASIIVATLPAYFNFSGLDLIVLLVIIGVLALLARRATREIGIPSTPPSPQSRPIAGSNETPDSVPCSTSEDDQVPSPGRAQSGSISAPARGPETPVVLLGGKARGRSMRLKRVYKLPRLDLLDDPPSEKSQADEVALEQSARVLEQKLAGFGVQAQVIGIQPGPVVSMYKLEPGEGVKVSQIINLADDLSLALRARSVRILAPIPGEAAVGIEIPNAKRETVYLRELLKAREFKKAASQLTIALGKDIAGSPVWADLAAMPHLLIAGATGTGKSVSIHATLASILFKATAADVRFILIDPKMLELSVYEGIPHLLVPVVMDPDQAAAALSWTTNEMESRYRIMRQLGARNIGTYNQMLDGGVLPQHAASARWRARARE